MVKRPVWAFAVSCAALLLILSACSLFSKGDDVTKTVAFDVGESFTTNLKDSDKRLVKCDIVLDITDDKNVVSDFEARNHVVRDAIYKTLRTLTEEDTQNDDILATLEQSIIESVNKSMDSANVHRVYFKNFVTANV